MFRIVAMIYTGVLLICMAINYAKAAEPIKVAIIDTGLDLEDSRFKSALCAGNNHWDFVSNSFNLKDEVGHGTHLVGLIEKASGNTPHCLLIYKYYSKSLPPTTVILNEVFSIYKAVRDGASIINLSVSGPEFDEKEYLAIKNNPKVTFVVAAGNQGENLDSLENYKYPASYRLPNMIVVGALDIFGKRLPSSNYGSAVTAWETGQNVYSTLPSGTYGYMSGTSQATAIHTGKLVKERSKK